MSPAVTTFLFEFANFVVLAGALGWLFFKPVRQALADRQQRLAEEDRLAAEKLAEAAKTESEINAAREGLAQELEQVRSRELDTVKQQAEKLLADTRVAVQQELDSVRAQAMRLSENEQTRLSQAAALAAAESLARFLKQIDGPELQTALVRSVCDQLRDVTVDSTSPIQVDTAVPLSSEQKAMLEEALGPAAAHAAFHVHPQLGPGIRVETSHGLIDASARGLSRFAQQSLSRQLAVGSANGEGVSQADPSQSSIELKVQQGQNG